MNGTGDIYNINGDFNFVTTWDMGNLIDIQLTPEQLKNGFKTKKVKDLFFVGQPPKSKYDRNGNISSSGKKVENGKNSFDIIILNGKEYDNKAFIRYEGNYNSDGLRHGKGIEFDEYGRKSYYGDMCEGLKSGIGTAYDSTGKIIYEGTWKKNKYLDGNGSLFVENNRLKYKGSWKNGNFNNGYASLLYENGKKYYEGDIKNEKFNGKGVLYYINGIKSYEGIFLNGMFNHKGRRYDKITGN